MKTIELRTTELKACKLTLCEGKAVVRNQNRINGLIGVRNSLIPERYQGLLAKATFVGDMVNETIVWTTDVFTEEPVALSELSGEAYSEYSRILSEAMRAYSSAFRNADEGVKKLVCSAITYASDATVYCGEGRVVITEWGMTKKGDNGPIGMLSIDDEDSPFHNPQVKEDENNGQDGDDIDDDKEDESPFVVTDLQEGEDEYIDIHDTENTDEDNTQTENYPKDEEPINNRDNNNNDNSNGGSQSGDVGGKKWWKWLWLLPLLLLAIILFSLLTKGCVSSKILDTTPAIDSSDVVLSEDSTRYIVKSRLVLFLTKEDVKIEDFVAKFREKYSDESKYILSNPDTVGCRLTLTLPEGERKEMEERLPEEFSEFGLVVLPETIYKTSYMPSDPAMSEDNKRWYFEETAVFDAWDETMGSDEIVVAIIDDGFDLNHPELKGKVVKPFNAVSHDSNVTPSASGHGTHVAATAIGNADNGDGVCGIAPKCKFMPIQVGDAQGLMSFSAVMDGVIYAISNGADVVNMSLGMSFGPFVQFAPVYVQKNFRDNMYLQEERVWNHLFNIAKKNDVTFVLAGGNENCIIGLDPMQRSPNTIKVSAVQPDERKASFSNYGDMSTVSAPGVRIFNAIPGNKYTYMDGTSMASPIVAGGCALLKSKDPSLSVNELAEILRRTGKPSPSDVGPIVNFAKALNMEYYEEEDCAKINERYNELLAELEELRRNYPRCIQSPDTLELPKNITLEKLDGRWMSTTSLYNEQQEKVDLYFTFNGTSTARLDIVEQNGDDYVARLNVSIENDRVYIDQVECAKNGSNGRQYPPYKFVLKPSPDRKAEGNAKNKIESGNIFNFNLVKI